MQNLSPKMRALSQQYAVVNKAFGYMLQGSTSAKATNGVMYATFATEDAAQRFQHSNKLQLVTLVVKM